MSILEKIVAAGKALIAAARAEYEKITSPIVRLAVLAIGALLAFWLAWQALPLLIFIALGVMIWVIIHALKDEDNDHHP